MENGVVFLYEHVSGGGLAGSELPGSWAAEGSAMRRALGRDFAAVAGVRVVLALDARLDDEPGPWTTVRVGPGESAAVVARLAAGSDHTATVAPEAGGILRDLAEAVDRAGGRSLGSSPAAIGRAADKLALAGHFDRLGIPSPASRPVRPALGLPRDATYPAVLKPIDGAGCLDTFLVESPDDPAAPAFGADLGVLQPFVPGEARGATFLVRRGGRAVLVGVARQEIARSGARLAYRGGTLLDEPLAADHPARLAVGSIEGLAGLVGVDYVEGPRATVIEINPRPTTSCVAIVAALGPGRLASAWLASSDRARDDLPEPDGPWPLARPAAPLRFRADGTVEAGPARPARP